MKITDSNGLLGGTVIDNAPEAGQDANDILPFSGESVYIMNVTTDRTLTITPTVSSTMNYVALVCDAGLINATVTITDSLDTVLGTHTYTNNRPSVLMFDIPQALYAGIKIKFTGPNGVISLIHAAAGRAFSVPNGGEQGGYKRNWMKSSFEQRAAENKDGYPVATVKRRVSLPGSLNIPNALTLFAESVWREFQDFAIGGAFFINEDEGKPEASYLCFNASFGAPTAHTSTRAMVSLTCKYRVYTGN